MLRAYKNDSQIDSLYKKHLNKPLDKNNGHIYGFYDGGKLVGYVVYYVSDVSTIFIEWIYAIPGMGYGKKFMRKLESKFRREGFSKIILNVSVDPLERKSTVMRRLNFYISLSYKVYDIKFRSRHGPLFYMEKKI